MKCEHCLGSGYVSNGKTKIAFWWAEPCPNGCGMFERKVNQQTNKTEDSMAEKNRDTGGSAFPQATVFDREDEGMTLRDYFAGQALLGLVTGLAARDIQPGDGNAEDAYRIADTMIAERKKA